jgi:hypothetical protein
MRKGVLGVSCLAVLLVLGFAMAALAQTGSSTGLLAGTSEETNESTTEEPKPTAWKAALTTGAEVPKPKGTRPGAGGTFTMTVTAKGDAYSLAYKLTFRNLTGRAMAAHIHKGKPGKTGSVLVALCGPCTSGKSRTVAAGKSVVTAIKAGAAYVNVHTAKNAAGELRGQVRKG